MMLPVNSRVLVFFHINQFRESTVCSGASLFFPAIGATPGQVPDTWQRECTKNGYGSYGSKHWGSPEVKQRCSAKLLHLVWLVVYLYIWKRWVRQLGWWHSQYFWKNKKCSKPPTTCVSMDSIGGFNCPEFHICVVFRQSAHRVWLAADHPQSSYQVGCINYTSMCMYMYIHVNM